MKAIHTKANVSGMVTLALDPGTDQTAWVLYDGTILSHGIGDNDSVLQWLREGLCTPRPDIIACEMIASYGMPVGREVFETCRWIGRFEEATKIPFRTIYRKDVKMSLCGTPRAKDGNIRQALIDLLGPQGVKKNPGPTFGITSHKWAALAVAVHAHGIYCQQ